MDWAALAALAVGYIAQHAKAYKQVPTVVVQLACFGVGFGAYALGHHWTPENTDWLENGIAWAIAVPGVSSFAGAAGLAPKTDSK
jgi:hypothetical protein